MSKQSQVSLAVACGILALALAIGACNGYKSPTNPGAYGGGGGGGGGGASNTPFNSGTLNAPTIFERVFPVAGSVGYHCQFHVSMGMTGTVTVAAGGADSVGVTAAGTSFTPASVTIRPGGKVHWSITSGTHTVTSN